MKNTLGRMILTLSLTLGLLINVFYSTEASAKKEKIQFPFITKVHDLIHTSNVGTSVMQGSADVEFKDIWVDDSTLDMTCNKSRCYLGLIFMAYNNHNNYNRWTFAGGGPLRIASKDSGTTLRQAISSLPSRVKANYSLSAVSAGQETFSNLCVTFIYNSITPYSSGDYSEIVPASSVSPGYANPNPGNCVQAPPANVPTCAFKDKSLAFDFGSISKNTANGVSREKDFTVNCSGDTSFTVNMLTGGKSLSLSNGMEATFSVGGIATNGTLKGNSGDNTLKMKATLSGTPDADGAFSGSTIMSIGYI